MASRRTLFGIGYIATGLGFLASGNPILAAGFALEGVNKLRAEKGGLGYADGGSGDGGRPKGHPIAPKMIQGGVRSIEQRVAYIRDIIRKDSTDPNVMMEAREVVSRKCWKDDGSKKWCLPPKAWAKEVEAITAHIRADPKFAEAVARRMFAASTDPNAKIGMRYTRDHAQMDTFSRARITRAVPAGDCDEFTSRLGALLRSIGYPVRMRVVQTSDASTWNHIYLLVGMPPTGPVKWTALDPTVEGAPFGWQVSGADEWMAAFRSTGRRPGVVGQVAAVHDFDV